MTTTDSTASSSDAFEDSAWASLGPVMVDMFGSSGADSLYTVDLDALLHHALDEPSLPPAARGAHSCRASTLFVCWHVEAMLARLRQRNANMHVLHVDTNAVLWRDRPVFALSRALLVTHLTHQHDSRPDTAPAVYRVPHWGAREGSKDHLAAYIALRRPSFLISTSPSQHLSTDAHLLVRHFLLHVNYAHKLPVSFLNGARFCGTDVLAFTTQPYDMEQPEDWAQRVAAVQERLVRVAVVGPSDVTFAAHRPDQHPFLHAARHALAALGPGPDQASLLGRVASVYHVLHAHLLSLDERALRPLSSLPQDAVANACEHAFLCTVTRILRHWAPGWAQLDAFDGSLWHFVMSFVRTRNTLSVPLDAFGFSADHVALVHQAWATVCGVEGASFDAVEVPDALRVSPKPSGPQEAQEAHQESSDDDSWETDDVVLPGTGEEADAADAADAPEGDDELALHQWDNDDLKHLLGKEIADLPEGESLDCDAEAAKDTYHWHSGKPLVDLDEADDAPELSPKSVKRERKMRQRACHRRRELAKSLQQNAVFAPVAIPPAGVSGKKGGKGKKGAHKQQQHKGRKGGHGRGGKTRPKSKKELREEEIARKKKVLRLVAAAKSADDKLLVASDNKDSLMAVTRVRAALESLVSLQDLFEQHTDLVSELDDGKGVEKYGERYGLFLDLLMDMHKRKRRRERDEVRQMGLTVCSRMLPTLRGLRAPLVLPDACARAACNVLDAFGFPDAGDALERLLPTVTSAYRQNIRKQGSCVEFQLRKVGDLLVRDRGQDDDRVVFQPDPWQVTLLECVDEGRSALVCAPTSSGKTFISYYCIESVLRSSDDGVVVYVAPSKALVNQVAGDITARFEKTYGKNDTTAMCGMFTRDYREYADNCQVLVTVPQCLEIFLLSAQRAKWSQRISYVIFDEVHCISNTTDPASDGGVVWEHLLCMVPCPILALSATVGNPGSFASWLREARKGCQGEPLQLIQHGQRYADLRAAVYDNADGVSDDDRSITINDEDRATEGMVALSEAAAASTASADTPLAAPALCQVDSVLTLDTEEEHVLASHVVEQHPMCYADLYQIVNGGFSEKMSFEPRDTWLLWFTLRAQWAQASARPPQRRHTVVSVCTGNTCRSPMLQALLCGASRAPSAPAHTSWAFHSCGVSAGEQREAAPHTVASVCALGDDAHFHSESAVQCVRQHSSRSLQTLKRELHDSESPIGTLTFLCMSERHAQCVSSEFPRARIRVLGVADPFGGERGEYDGVRDALLPIARQLVCSGGSLEGVGSAVEGHDAPVGPAGDGMSAEEVEELLTSLGPQEVWKDTIDSGKLLISQHEVRQWESDVKAAFLRLLRDSSHGPVARAAYAELTQERSQCTEPRQSDFLQLLRLLKHRKHLPCIAFAFSRRRIESMVHFLVLQLEAMERAYLERPDVKRERERAAVKRERMTKLHKAKRDARGKGSAKDPDAAPDDTPDMEALIMDEPDVLPQFCFRTRGRGFSADERKRLLRRTRWPEGHPLIRALKRGIGLHHAGLPRHYRRAVEDLFRGGDLEVVLATGTLAMGVHMPCKTVVFLGDNLFLNPTSFRQMSGRAGRRGFDTLGRYIFFGIPWPKVLRLLNSSPPMLRSQFPMSLSMLLRLFTKYFSRNVQSNKSLRSSVLQEMDRLMRRPLMAEPLSPHHQHTVRVNSALALRSQLKHFVRFGVEFLQRIGLVNATGQPVGLASLVNHLHWTGADVFVFFSILSNSKLARRLGKCGRGESEEAHMLRVLTLLAHIFCRRPVHPQWSSQARGCSSVVLPSLREALGEDVGQAVELVIDDYNVRVRSCWQSYAAVVSRHQSSRDASHALPLSGAPLRSVRAPLLPPGAPARPNSLAALLRAHRVHALVRSPFSALVGLGDSFESVGDLTRNLRGDVYLDDVNVPLVDRHERVNSYAVDFFKHGNVLALERENRVKNVWYELKNFMLLLKTVSTAMQRVADESRNPMTDIVSRLAIAFEERFNKTQF